MDVDLLEVGGDRLTGEQVAEAVAGLNAIDRDDFSPLPARQVPLI